MAGGTKKTDPMRWQDGRSDSWRNWSVCLAEWTSRESTSGSLFVPRTILPICLLCHSVDICNTKFSVSFSFFFQLIPSAWRGFSSSLLCIPQPQCALESREAPEMEWKEAQQSAGRTDGRSKPVSSSEMPTECQWRLGSHLEVPLGSPCDAPLIVSLCAARRRFSNMSGHCWPCRGWMQEKWGSDLLVCFTRSLRSTLV